MLTLIVCSAFLIVYIFLNKKIADYVYSNAILYYKSNNLKIHDSYLEFRVGNYKNEKSQINYFRIFIGCLVFVWPKFILTVITLVFLILILK